MAYLFGIFLLIGVLIVLHLFTEITLKQKLGVGVVLSMLILAAYLYNQQGEKRRVHLDKILLEFTHGKTIRCADMDVNNTAFSYSSGTQSFVGKRESEMSGYLISLEQCQ